MFVSCPDQGYKSSMTKGFISAQALQLRGVKLFLSSQAAAFLFFLLDSLFVTGIVCSISLYWHMLLHAVSWFVHVQRNMISLDSFCLFPFSQKSLKYSPSFTIILIARSFFFQLSILVHPDKNQDDADRAQKAFEGNTLSLGCSGLVVAAFLVVG